MTDLSSLGFKKSNNDDAEHEGTYDKVESLISKNGSDIPKYKTEQSNYESYFTIPEAPYFPSNPIDKTYEELDSLHSTLKKESSKSSVSTNIWNKKMFFISILALVISITALIVSAVFSILSYNSSNQSSTKLEKLILEQNILIKTNSSPKISNKIKANEKNISIDLKKNQ